MWNTWQGLIVVATFSIFLVSAFAYTIGHIIVHRKVIVWAQNQMYEGLVSIIMAILFIFFTSLFCSLDVSIVSQGICYTNSNQAAAFCAAPYPIGTGYTVGWAPQGQTCPITGTCNAQDVGSALLQRFRDSTWNVYLTVSAVNSFLAFIGSYSFDVSFGGVGIAMGVLSGLNQLTNPLAMGMSLITIAYVLTQTQMILLRMTEGMFVIMLPVGMILRSLGATRGFGGALIAIAVGFFMIYPFLVVLFYGDLLNVNIFATGTYGNSSSEVNNAAGNFASLTNPTNILTFLQNAFGAISMFLSGTWLLNILLSFINSVAMAMVGAVVIPLIMFMVLVSFTKALSKALGEQVDVSNLTRLI
jgi:hypothetical protein